MFKDSHRFNPDDLVTEFDGGRNSILVTEFDAGRPGMLFWLLKDSVGNLSNQIFQQRNEG